MLPHLQQLASGFEVVAVFYNSGQPAKNRRWAVRKAKKVLRIGLLGVLIGFRMRRWYGVNTSEILGVKSLGQLRENNGFYFDLFELPSLNGRRMVQAMKSARVDLVVSLGNGFISPSVYSIPKFGMLNVHHEQLPSHRNAQSVIWQLYGRSSITGYTIHEISREIDGGRIVLREDIPIAFEKTLALTVSRTYAALWVASTHGLAKVLNDFGSFIQEADIQEGEIGHFTTPSLLQYVRIWLNWRRLK